MFHLVTLLNLIAGFIAQKWDGIEQHSSFEDEHLGRFSDLNAYTWNVRSFNWEGAFAP